MAFSKDARLAAVFLTSSLVAGCGGHGGHGGADAGGLPTPQPGGLDVTGNALFVALGTNGGVAVVDVDSWRVAGTLHYSTTYLPHHLSLSPDRTRVAVGAPAADLSGGHGDGGHGDVGGAIYVLNSRTGDVVAQSLAGGTAHNLAFLPSGNAVAFALLEHNVLHLASPTDLSLTGFVTVGGSPLEATPTPAGDKLLVANSADGTISVVDAASKTIAKTLTVGANPIGAWIGADGRAYVTSESDKKLSVIDLATFTVLETVTLAGIPGQALSTAGGEVWIALEGAGKVAILGGSPLGPVAEIKAGMRPHGLALSPDGASMYLTDENGGQVIELDVATRAMKRMLNVGGRPNGILFRPAL
jgi:YVTN family beta-propeller protein